MKKNYKILYAEDNQLMANSLIRILHHNGYNNITHVINGDEALNKVLENNYDLIITDNRMPKMTGINFMKNIRNKGINIPAILMSGTLFDLDKEDKSLFQGIIEKPSGISNLEYTIKNILEGKNG